MRLETPISMTLCDACNTPNPQGVSACLGCGVRLDVWATLSGSAAYQQKTCPNCNAPFLESSDHCSRCGRAVSGDNGPVNTAATADTGPATVIKIAPHGWIAEPLSNGRLSLTRTFWRRLSEGIAFPFLCLVIGGLLLSLPHFMGQITVNGLVRAAATVAVLYGIAAVFWQWGARETFEIGPAFLEQRKFLGSIGRLRRFNTAACLIVMTTQRVDGKSRHLWRRLSVSNGAQELFLDRSWHRSRLLLADSAAWNAEDNVSRLAAFLSAQTNWPVTHFGDNST
jgi:hypothetical protein